MSARQRFVISAWRENCAKKFCVTGGGARCPDFSRDVTVKLEQDPQKQNDKGDCI